MLLACDAALQVQVCLIVKARSICNLISIVYAFLSLLCASHSSEIGLAGWSQLRSTLAAALVLFPHVVPHEENILYL